MNIYKLSKQKKIVAHILMSIIFLLPISPVLAQNDLYFINIKTEQVNNITFKIIWSTNKESGGKVVYGTDKNNLSSFIIDGKRPSKYHEISIGNLEGKATYYYKITIFDNYGKSDSSIRSFKTEKYNDDISPKISNFEIPYVTGNTAVLTWDSDQKSTSRAEYGEDETYPRSAGNNNKVTEHLVIIRNLKINTTYYVRVFSVDEDSDRSFFKLKIFTTGSHLANKESLEILNLRPVNSSDPDVTEHSIEVTFKTNHYAKGTVTLQKRGRGTQKETLDYNLRHSAVFTGLLSNAFYTVKISVKDVFGKTESEKLEIRTKESETIIIKNEKPVKKEADDVKEDDVVVLGEEFSYYTRSDALYKISDSAKVYSIIKRQRYVITSADSFIEYGYDWDDIKTITKEALFKYPRVKLVKSADYESIYYLYERDGKVMKIKILSPTVFNSYTGNSWGNVIKINQLDMEFYEDVKLIRAVDSDDIYYLENGEKRYVSTAVFESRGFNYDDIMTVNKTHLDGYKTGTPLQ